MCFAGHTYYLFFCHSVEKHRLDSINVLPAERTLSVPLMDLTRALGALTGMAARYKCAELLDGVHANPAIGARGRGTPTRSILHGSSSFIFGLLQHPQFLQRIPHIYGYVPTHVTAPGEAKVELGDGLFGPSLVGHGHDGVRPSRVVYTLVHVIHFATGFEQGFQVLLGD